MFSSASSQSIVNGLAVPNPYRETRGTWTSKRYKKEIRQLEEEFHERGVGEEGMDLGQRR